MKKAPERKKAAAPPAVAPAAAPSENTGEGSLAAFGVAAEGGGSGLLIKGVLPGSPADELGLKPGDELAYLQSGPAGSRAEAAAGFRSWSSGTRLSAVLRRDLRLVTAEALESSWEPALSRSPDALSPLEQVLRQRRLENSTSTARELVDKAPSIEVVVPARQSFWLRFPRGLPADAAPGLILQAEVTTAVTTGPELDFMALPPGSAVWVKVLDASSAGETRQVRLLVFKLRPRNGQIYGVSGRLTAISGDQKLSRVSSGGTLVVAEPVPAPGRRPKARWNLLNPSDRVKVELLEPLTLAEAPGFYLAGPGLWVRTKDTPAGRRFEISHVIAGRAAERAGLRVGHELLGISGKRAEHLEFQNALELLYGRPGSRVSVRALRNPQGKPESIELERGVSYVKDAAQPLPLPFVKNSAGN